MSRPLGLILSEETKAKMSKSHKGKRMTDEAKAKLSKAHRGKILTEEHRARISKACRGRQCSDETRRRLSKSAMGRVVSKETRQKICEANLGRKMSEEQKRKLGEAHKGLFVGEKSYNWQGGISFEPYTPEFNDNLRDMVRERDGHVCQVCGKTQRENKRRLSVHHIDYNKENNTLKNLITLCISCNAVVNFNREDWANYFKEAALPVNGFMLC